MNNKNTKRKKIFYTSSIAKGSYQDQLENAIQITTVGELHTRLATEIKQMKEFYRATHDKAEDPWGDCNRFSTWRIVVEYLGETKIKR